MTGRPRAKRTHRSEAIRLLDRSGKSQAEIAAVARVTQPTVNRWFTGQKVASEAAQVLLEAGLGIGRHTWALPPSAPSKATEGAGAAPPASKPPAASKTGRLGRLAALEHQQRVADHANALLEKLMAATDSNAREQAEAMKASSTANACLGRLEALQRQTLDGIFESEDWERVKVAVTKALDAFERKHGPLGGELVGEFERVLQGAGLPLGGEP